MSILIKNAMILRDLKFIKSDVLIDGNIIKKTGEIKDYADYIIDAKCNLLIPGFVNTHAHVAMTGFKGLLDDTVLSDFLEKSGDLDSSRTDNGIYNSSLLGMYEMINSGITTFVDLYYSEDIIQRAAEKTGIRAYLAWAVLDDEYTTQKGSPVKNAEHFITMDHPENVTPMIGVQGIYVSSDETYMKVLDLSKKYNVMMHTHLSETRKEVYDTVKRYGERPVEHLNKINFLSDKLIAAHCVWVTINEIKMLSKNNVKVSWNSVSNAKLASGGNAPIPEMLNNNINVSIGTDSSGSNNSLDMFQEMKFSLLSINNERWDPSIIKSGDIFRMATLNGYSALNLNGGIIEPGSIADLIIIDRRAVNMIPGNDFIKNIVFSGNPSNVLYVIVNGKILKENGRLNNFNPDEFIDAEFL
ncbi:amidohydrolase family protein [Picrophilus oshimae]|uniref:5-methylthioadenosine/S-adenosylhomocysteine deaminase n=1 Tax=Picrophilus torridus (strain ATCC 700027 / DSM 9790 / JCM 10055 / NBRC 100828 / KAW 2/3) TaxID=1122961 RepID=A0A8G2FVS3_PICTO|nr:amidohydrolase family protein [Picrophilus oshimae]SMD30382.1 5-methylthioadenosine/S-adenosylhomocysteine deaminase [Picrophilus oshimae DSM 9789]